MRKNIFKNVVLFLLFLCIAFNISYWAIAKYDVTTDFKAVNDARYYIKMARLDFDGVPYRYFNRFLMPATVSVFYRFFDGINDSFLTKYYEISENKIVQLSFGIVNILFLTFTAFLFYLYCKELDFSEEESLISVLLFFTSFFVITYYTLPLVDSMACFFVMACFYAVKKGNLFLLSISFLIGVFVKEAIFVVILVVLLNGRPSLLKNLVACLPGAILYFIYMSQNDHSSGENIINIVSSPVLLKQYVQTGIKSLNFYTLIEMVETFMFIWILLIIGIFKKDKPAFLKKQLWLLLLPFAAPFLVGCSVVGRVSFYLFPIAIPLAALSLRDIMNFNSAKRLAN